MHIVLDVPTRPLSEAEEEKVVQALESALRGLGLVCSSLSVHYPEYHKEAQ